MSLKINVPFSVVNILLLALTSMTFAQTQSPQTTSPEGKREGIQHKVQLQFLVTSNKVNDRSEFPSALEPVVKQLKLSSGFKSHWLVATYIYSVAEGASLEVNDVTYAPFESGGGLVPKFFSFAVSDIKSNPALETLYISRLKFQMRQRIFTEKTQGEDTKSTRLVFDTGTSGISTDLTVHAGAATLVGTTTSALSDGVLALIVTVF